MNALIRARINVNDEFYTRFEDIVKEMANYDFHGKSVYCNCDDWETSMVFKFFKDNFNELGLKMVYTTSYVAGGHGKYAKYNGKHLFTDELIEDGDFRSTEAWLVAIAADVIVTNPPFSLFREFIDFVENIGKKYIIVGPENVLVYKNVFPLVKDKKLWTGYNMLKEFILPNGQTAKFGNIVWWTNMKGIADKVSKHTDILYSNEYYRYDNYDAINVDRVTDIPFDYYGGAIGVPVTFLKHMNTSEWEILGVSSSSVENAGVCHIEGTPTGAYINGNKKFARLFIKRIPNAFSQVS